MQAPRRRRASIRVTTLALVGIFTCLAALLFALRNVLPAAHQNWSIQYFSSDGAAYFEQYQRLWLNVAITERPVLLLTGTPIVLMKLTQGNLLLILAANLVLMALTLKVALNSLPTLRARFGFLVGVLAFPYFLFGFLSLNKEVYMMCSAIWFGCYYVRGKTSDLVVALFLAFAARYYMFAATLFLWVVFPRGRTPRYWIALATLVGISFVAPFLKTRIPGYSSEHLLEGAGFTQLLFAQAVDSHAYALIYPLQFMLHVPGRIYSVLIGLGRPADPMEAVVSLLTLVLLPLAAYILTLGRSLSSVPKRFVWMAFLAPIPIMWTAIGHWRYFSYIYVFLLFASVLYLAERREQRHGPRTEAEHADAVVTQS